jgi:hypothetical protein
MASCEGGYGHTSLEAPSTTFSFSRTAGYLGQRSGPETSQVDPVVTRDCRSSNQRDTAVDHRPTRLSVFRWRVERRAISFVA